MLITAAVLRLLTATTLIAFLQCGLVGLMCELYTISCDAGDSEVFILYVHYQLMVV